MRFSIRDFWDGTAAIAVLWLAFLLIMLGRINDGQEPATPSGPSASEAAATPAAP